MNCGYIVANGEKPPEVMPFCNYREKTL